MPSSESCSMCVVEPSLSCGVSRIPRIHPPILIFFPLQACYLLDIALQPKAKRVLCRSAHAVIRLPWQGPGSRVAYTRYIGARVPSRWPFPIDKPSPPRINPHPNHKPIPAIARIYNQIICAGPRDPVRLKHVHRIAKLRELLRAACGEYPVNTGEDLRARGPAVSPVKSFFPEEWKVAHLRPGHGSVIANVRVISDVKVNDVRPLVSVRPRRPPLSAAPS